MTPGSQCISLIKKHEGLRTSAYKCPAGVWTVGYGHTRNVKAGDVITEKEAENLLIQDLAAAAADVSRLVKVPLTQGQFDALCSFVFNLGAGSLMKSSLLKYVNAGDFKKAADEFEKWVYSGGRILKGLVNRRKDERQLFIS